MIGTDQHIYFYPNDSEFPNFTLDLMPNEQIYELEHSQVLLTLSASSFPEIQRCFMLATLQSPFVYGAMLPFRGEIKGEELWALSLLEWTAPLDAVLYGTRNAKTWQGLLDSALLYPGSFRTQLSPSKGLKAKRNWKTRKNHRINIFQHLMYKLLAVL